MVYNNNNNIFFSQFEDLLFKLHLKNILQAKNLHGLIVVHDLGVQLSIFHATDTSWFSKFLVSVHEDGCIAAEMFDIKNFRNPTG